MGKDDDHVHSYQKTEVLNPLGRNSDDTKNVYAVEDHYFCRCGDFYTVSKGTREI
jgi:hypothetical protein